jgi:hypothetical protein
LEVKKAKVPEDEVDESEEEQESRPKKRASKIQM